MAGFVFVAVGCVAVEVGAASSAVVSVVNGGGVVCAAEATGVGFWAEWQEVARATVTRHAMKA